MIDPATITAVGGAVAAVGAAFFGGKTGGANSLNGFKEEVRGRFDSVDERLGVLTKADGMHEEAISALRRRHTDALVGSDERRDVA